MQLTSVLLSQRNRLLLLAAALVFVLTQTIIQQHSHEGDLSLHPDCQICLKLGSQNNPTVAKFSVPDLPVSTVRFQVIVPDLPFIAVPAPRSRAPPHAA
ncbi:MAG: hypothetical protein R3F41_08200 [Gammaproteobacteria bacterium]|nr:hypothetical protein [Pseudomonadales bacterium]MCP5347083.1 hypothetical protein [Pseudomonadales bacterium]